MDDVAKLLDFGLVRPATAAPAASLSAEGQILGTPLFMSPEQAIGNWTNAVTSTPWGLSPTTC
jgi:serine/threonine-protein kinase